MQIKFYKATSLPAILEPNAFYYIADGEYANAYLTDATGTAMPIGNSDMINDHILENAQLNHPMRVVGTVAEMATITENSTTTMMILVLDATADPSITEGSALYAFDASTRITHKVSEYSELDLELNWTNVIGRPESQVSDIDDAVASRHVHYNMEILDKWSEQDGLPVYDGSPIDPFWETKNW